MFSHEIRAAGVSGLQTSEIVLLIVLSISVQAIVCLLETGSDNCAMFCLQFQGYGSGL